MKEQEIKKSILKTQKSKDRQEILSQLKQFERQSKNVTLTKRKRLEETIQDNLDMVRRKQELFNHQNSQSKDEENKLLKRFSEQEDSIKANLYEKSWIQDQRKFDEIKDLSQSRMKKNFVKAISKIEGINGMSEEFDLLMKNKERHTQKIKNLVKRNDKIYNKTKNSSYKNLSVIEKERDEKLQKSANNSFITEIKRRNNILDEIANKRKKERLQLHSDHLGQITEKMIGTNKNRSFEMVNDKKMVLELEKKDLEALKKEKEEQIKKRAKHKQNLDRQKLSDMTLEGRPEYTKEFELNKSLLKNIYKP